MPSAVFCVQILGMVEFCGIGGRNFSFFPGKTGLEKNLEKPSAGGNFGEKHLEYTSGRAREYLRNFFSPLFCSFPVGSRKDPKDPIAEQGMGFLGATKCSEFLLWKT